MAVLGDIECGFGKGTPAEGPQVEGLLDVPDYPHGLGDFPCCVDLDGVPLGIMDGKRERIEPGGFRLGEGHGGVESTAKEHDGFHWMHLKLRVRIGMTRPKIID
jgi:hypothetical protein